MYLKKLFYKLTNKEKHFYYKNEILKKEIIKDHYLKSFKNGIDKKITEIHNNIMNKKELSFLHYGHLGDVINSLSILKLIEVPPTKTDFIFMNSYNFFGIKLMLSKISLSGQNEISVPFNLFEHFSIIILDLTLPLEYCCE